MKKFFRKLSHALSYILYNRNQFMLSMIRSVFTWLPDRLYLELLYKYSLGKRLHLTNPQTYNEKLQWLKLYDRNPLYTQLVDKYGVKEYVSNIIGAEHVIKTIGYWNSVGEINWNILPNQFVLKTTHGGGNSGVVICKNKASLDKAKAIEKLNLSMKEDLYKKSKEWPYKNVKKAILAEEYIENNSTKDLKDYKFFCFNGKVKALFIGSERQVPGEEVKFDFFDENCNHLDIQQGHPNSKKLPKSPDCFEEMKNIAEKLSKGIPHVRVDLYEANGKVFFGEMTFYHFGGVVPFNPPKWDEIFGSWITLPNNSAKR